MSAYEKIREAMRENEAELLQHIRTHRVFSITLFPLSWMRALDRLESGKMVYYNRRKGCYEVRRYARPVTKKGGAYAKD